MKRLIKKEAAWNPNKNKETVREKYMDVVEALGEFRAAANSDASTRESICPKLDSILDEITQIKNSLIESIDKRSNEMKKTGASYKVNLSESEINSMNELTIDYEDAKQYLIDEINKILPSNIEWALNDDELIYDDSKYSSDDVREFIDKAWENFCRKY